MTEEGTENVQQILTHLLTKSRTPVLNIVGHIVASKSFYRNCDE